MEAGAKIDVATQLGSWVVSVQSTKMPATE